MEVKILGRYGVELSGARFCSFVIDGKLLLDAGAVTSVLRLSEERRISNILVTHIHLYHTKVLPFLDANLAGDRLHQSLNIISFSWVIEGIKAPPFNGALWRNFTDLPTLESPVLKFLSIQAGAEIPMQAGRLQ